MYINVNDYKNERNDSAMIQAAIDAARDTGKAVVIPKVNRKTGKDVWDISEGLVLYSGSIVILQNCHLRLADGAVCNMFRNSNAKTDAALDEDGVQKDIRVMGMGKAILDGGIHNGLYEDNGIARKVMKKSEHKISENCMMFFQNVENLIIENITVKNHRYWGICLYRVSYSRISGIHYESESNVPNQDGVDVCKGCHDVIVENITGCVGDNLVALIATEDEIYHKVVKNLRDGDIRNVTIRNIMGYGVGGCALIRLLNHDGYKIYNIRIDNVIETSPWSENDASVAQNPDLVIKTDDEGNIIPWKKLIPGEIGYRTEATILIGESYWYSKEKAKHGDTFGISVSNVMTHARYAVFLNNTLMDSSFDNIRLFGNGYMAVYFGEGQMENLRFSNISYDKDCRPLPSDEHIFIEWNNTRSDGLSCVYFNGTEVKDITFDGMYCSSGIDSVFGGFGEGNIVCRNLVRNDVKALSGVKGIHIK